MISERSISSYERLGHARPIEEARARTHTLIDGQTLSGLANRYYRDWRLWRLIADRNKIVDPRVIATGTRLVIPDRPLQSGSFESL